MRKAALFVLIFAAQSLAGQVFPGQFEETFNATSACTNEAITGQIECSAVEGVPGGRDLFQMQCTGAATGLTTGNPYVINQTVVFGSKLDLFACHGTEYFDFQIRLISLGSMPDELFRVRERTLVTVENELFCKITHVLLDFGSVCRGRG